MGKKYAGTIFCHSFFVIQILDALNRYPEFSNRLKKTTPSLREFILFIKQKRKSVKIQAKNDAIDLDV